MIISVIIAISLIDGRSIIKKQLHRELYAYIAFTIAILVYGFMYFSNSYNASIADILDKILVHK